MRAAFLTTASNDVDNVISVWDCFNEPSARVSFDHMKPVDDARIVRDVQAATPDVIFYIGSVSTIGMPSVECLRALRGFAPSIHMCFDAVDEPWHPLLHEYRKRECFDLQVSIDGVHGTPVDLVTVAPVDPALYDLPGPARTIRCGCSGNIGLMPYMKNIGNPPAIGTDPRGKILAPLMNAGLVRFRQRIVVGTGSYPAHVEFMQSCQMIINTSFSGSGERHHVKQRVNESAFAGCALLEDEGSPIGDWWPPDCYFPYRDGADAERLIKTLPDDAIDECARQRSEYVRLNYMPKMLFGEMMDRAGL